MEDYFLNFRLLKKLIYQKLMLFFGAYLAGKTIESGENGKRLWQKINETATDSIFEIINLGG